jgi:hypothetical protein
MKVEYTLTPDDYAAVMHERVHNSPGKPRWPRYLSMASVMMVVLGQGAFLVGRGVPWPVVTGICLPLAVLLFVVVYRFLGPAIFKLSMAGTFRQAGVRGMDISLEVRPEGLAVTTGATTSLTAWRALTASRSATPMPSSTSTTLPPTFCRGGLSLTRVASRSLSRAPEVTKKRQGWVPGPSSPSWAGRGRCEP